MIVSEGKGNKSPFSASQLLIAMRLKSLLTKLLCFVGICTIASVIFVFNNDPRGVAELSGKISRLYGLKNVWHIPEILSYKFKSIFSVGAPNMHIDMGYEEIQRLEFMRQNAMLGEINFDYVPAKIRFEEQSVKVDLRPKGDRSVHWNSFDSMSFRTKIKKDKTILGMKKFSIQKPRVRNYVGEWVWLEMMRKEGFVTPRYEFVNLIFNGKNRGLYVLEEHYTKYLVENSKKREGPILRFKEGPGSSENFELAEVEPYEISKWSSGSALLVVEKATNLMKSFQQGLLSIDEVFDVKKMATYFALSDLNGTPHGTVPKSIRFYYNPVTSRLEPVPFDGHRGTTFHEPTFQLSAELGLKEGTWTHDFFGNWFRAFFNDKDRLSKAFHAHYLFELKRFSEKSYLNNFFEEIDEDLEKILLLIYDELPPNDNVFSFGPFPYFFDRETYFETQKAIKDRVASPFIEAFFAERQDNNIVLDVRNKSVGFAYEIIGIQSNELFFPVIGDNVIPVSEGALDRKPLEKLRFNAGDESFYDLTDFEIIYKYIGQEEIFSHEIAPYREDLTDLVKEPIRIVDNLRDFPFIIIQEEEKVISIPAGKYKIKKPLVVPHGYTFKLNEGTNLDLESGAYIISYSPLLWNGTKKNPITITGDATSSSSGLLVLEAEKASSLKFVNFIGLSNPSFDSWSVPGAVSFYESDLIASDLYFFKNVSEDALNVIRSKSEILNAHFDSVFSDAIDVDFGNAVIENSLFTNIGNDAIDVSGATLVVNGNRMENIGDKALSAGESSLVSGRNLTVSLSEIGITSKDNSTVDLSLVSLEKVKLGYTAFQKKSEFGPAYIRIENGVSKGHQLLHLIENNSLLYLNENQILGENSDVQATLYGVNFGAATVK